MEEILEKISILVENGKVNLASPYPPDLKGQEGAEELTGQALELGIDADTILQACIKGMHRIGERFGRNEVFVPELLMASKAMYAVLDQLKPFFESGAVKTRGKFVIGTVAGDLHDIGKNLVSMVVRGNGWEVVDLGVDVASERFVAAVRENPGCVVGLSALLTTTMANMATTVKQLKEQFPRTKVLVGGAPVNEQAAREMGADAYGENPQVAVEILSSFVN